MVGYALHRLRDGSSVPWYSVVNRKGLISLPADSHSNSLQRALLESEGVDFGANGIIDLRKFGWKR